MQHQGFIGPRGSLSLAVKRAPKVGWAYQLRNLPNLWRGWWKHQVAVALGISHLYGELYVRVNRCQCGAPSEHRGKVCPIGQWIDYGRVSTRVVTTAGANYIAADFAGGASDINLMRYHGIGTGTTAEAVGDTALVTESTIALNPDSTRATGSQANPSGNVYRTVGTLTADGAIACTEHGIFNQAATGGGTLLDRSVFSVLNLASGDSIQATYDLTINTGG